MIHYYLITRLIKVNFGGFLKIYEGQAKHLMRMFEQAGCQRIRLLCCCEMLFQITDLNNFMVSYL